MERLQKRVAQAGVASRRKVELMIKEGRVKVNGEVITEMGILVSPKDRIEVDEIVVTSAEKKYYCLYKPRYIISSVNDEHGRKTVIDLLPPSLKSERLFPVGRLDYDTKGIMIITNDGEFMNLMVGPQSGVEKEYLARIKGIATEKDLIPLTKGLVVKEVKYLPTIVKIEDTDLKNKSTLVRIIITEGKNHQVKLMFEALGFPVKRLTRIRFGCLELGDLQEGEVRPLTIHEVKTLRELAKKDKVLKKVPLHKYRQY